jgi:hypothetical protein
MDNLLHQAIIAVFHNENGKKLIELFKQELWDESFGNINNTNEFVFKEGKKALLKDIEAILHIYNKLGKLK